MKSRPLLTVEVEQVRVEFLKRELKEDKLEVSQINALYLNTIREAHPKVWSQFMNLMLIIESGELLQMFEKRHKVKKEKL